MTTDRVASRDGATTVELASLLGLLGDPTRLKLMALLMTEEYCVTQCTEHIGLTHSAVSKQLSALADAGLVTGRRSGRRHYFTVTDPAAVTALLRAGDSLITAHKQD